MKRVFPAFMFASIGLLVAASTALGQTTSTTGTPASDPPATRPATTTVRGDTGLWFVPTGEVLPAKKWSFSFSRLEGNDGQGFSNISSFPLSVGVGLGGHVELFGSWNILTRIDRDTQPIFFSAASATGVGGGLLVDYPFDRTPWISKRGDLWLGGKFNFMSEGDRDPFALALRAMFKLPTGDKTAGTSTGKSDAAFDLVLSKDAGKTVELSGYGGVIIRGNPAGYTLTNGFQWGFGAGFPSHSPVRMTTELYGESYFNHTITAPAGLMGSDGSPVPTSTMVKSPAYLNVGLTWQMKHGWFIGVGGNWNLTQGSRADAGAGFTSDTFDAADYQVRIGFHPGVRTYVPPPPPPPPPAPPTPAPAPPPPVHTLTVKAACAKCTVEIGQTDTVTATAQDSIGCALTYRWSAPTGTFANATQQSTSWTAPGQDGSVPVMVTATCPTDNKTASDSVNINVTKPPVKTYEFEDVHFDFDRYTLLPDALRTIDEAVAAMQSDPTLRLTIEGHTCDIGTAEYNLALGERRAKAVFDYITSRGIAADRLHTVSYGEEQPKYDNSREETRRLNRRAALVVRLDRGN